MKYYCHPNLLKIIPSIIFFYWKQKQLLFNKKNWIVKEFTIKTFNRSSTILPIFRFCSFKVYNGQTFTNVLIKKERFFYKLGEFSFTKVPARHNKKRNKKR